ncbi:MAG: rod shape-determining protein RodA [Candidatus Omnitrophica bacterium]|nr:rod shape-determining protein RodA [Candidatus Omnitrophota bacterium]
MLSLLSGFKKFDRIILGILLLLLIFGLIVLFSASCQRQASTGKNFVLNQGIWIFLGLILVFMVSKTSYHSFLSVSYIIFAIHILFLILVLLMGKTALGAQRWISIGGIGFQPSEFVKVFTILALARMIGDNPSRLKTKTGLIGPFFIVLLPMALIFKQPDLGTAIVLLPIFLAMIWAGGIRLKYFWAIILSGLLSLPLFWSFLKDYQRDRLMVFINPNADPLGAGYTINQSKIAIGSGMLFGKGWLSGTQNQLNFLPERHTDFIFSVVGEEFGFMGTAVMLGLFLLLILRGLKIAELTKDVSGKLIVVGITTMLAFHVIINIGMTLGLMPVVGMPLPFISYGRSALIANLIAVGFLLNVQMNRTVF